LGNSVIAVSSITIGSGYAADVPNQAALILGPTGVAFNPATGLLYVASTADNAIYAIPDALTRLTSAGRGELIFKDNAVLRGALGLVSDSTSVKRVTVPFNTLVTKTYDTTPWL